MTSRVRHIVVFEWNPGIDRAHVEGFMAALDGLPALIPEIREYEFGADLGIGVDPSDFAVTAVFDDRAGYEVYRDHPAHRAVVEAFVVGSISRRSAIQIAI